MNTENEYITDDDLLREQAMCDGPKQVSKFKLRPVTALSLSWMQRTRVFDDEHGDVMQKTASFAYLHTADKAEIRGVVNNLDKFLSRVDLWIEENITSHKELNPVSDEMMAAINRYLAAGTNATDNATTEFTPAIKN